MLKKTPLFSLHENLGGKMIDFANYSLPLQYPTGILAEHLHTRESASIFDVSHMGQISIFGKEDEELCRTILTDIPSIKIGFSKYAVIVGQNGGVIDDCIITRESENELSIVCNASRKKLVIPFLKKFLSPASKLIEHNEYSLLALQGPKAEEALCSILNDAKNLTFMQSYWENYQEQKLKISRTGYTGEDGFEISIPTNNSLSFCKKLLELKNGKLVKMAGLGARNSLRIEAGLCLYGNELTEEITPVEAGLSWTIPSVLKEKGNFLGAKNILKQIKEKPTKTLVGLLPEGKIPIRESTLLYSKEDQPIGKITSGIFSPSLKTPIAMGYIENSFDKKKEVFAFVRKKKILCTIVKLPFIKQNYKK